MTRRLPAMLALAVFIAGSCPAACAGTLQGETSRSLCYDLVANRTGISESLLRAVGKIESNNRPNAIHFDADGTHDVGVMQVNSSHFPELASRYHITEQMLLDRPCLNIAVGARILGGFLQRYGFTWRAVGSYGAGTMVNKEAARRQYATLVARALSKGWHASQVAEAAPATRRLVVME